MLAVSWPAVVAVLDGSGVVREGDGAGHGGADGDGAELGQGGQGGVRFSPV